MLLNALPTEILIQIFGYLDYWTLRLRVGPSSRRLYNLLQDLPSLHRSTSFARLLFRDPLDTTIPKQLNHTSSGFITHPVLLTLQVREDPLSPSKSPFHIDNIGFDTSDAGFVRLRDHPVSLENATSPSWDLIFFTLGDPVHQFCKSVDNRVHNSAITVLQLVKNISNLLVEFYEDHDGRFYTYLKELKEREDRYIEQGGGGSIPGLCWMAREGAWLFSNLTVAMQPGNKMGYRRGRGLSIDFYS